ncbi:FtsK/SpoIIIE domain-containing protein [Actinomycetes bacterium KLBMP 9759]
MMVTFNHSRKSNGRRGDRNATVAPRPSTRSTGVEVRAAAWLLRHPLFLLLPATVVGLVWWSGPVGAASVLGGLVAGVLVWWRVHPPSYDRWVVPRIRTVWRRWTAYRGRRWRGVLEDCELTRDARHNGAVLVPRVVRVRAVSPSIDVLTVRMVRGQHAEVFTDRAPELAEAFGAHRVAVTRARPGLVSMVIERRMPFTTIVPATPIPLTVDEVDLRGLDVGDTETGHPFLLPVRGKHLLVVGASGAGKSSLLWNPLRAIGPLIKDGRVRLWVVDLKGGTETERGEPLFHRWATTGSDAVELVTDFRDSMLDRQQRMREAKVRINTISVDSPLELLIIDEMAMLTAYGDRSDVREALRLLAEVLTQGRSADHQVWGYVQEPTKDVVDVRDLFTIKACLGVTTASHVDMALGDGARDRGALADHIPIDPEHAGIGFVIDGRTRLPIRIRAGWVSDRDIDELVHRCAPPGGDVLPFPNPTPDNPNDLGKEHVS